MSKYSDIIARLEAATGPDRDIDRTIAFDLGLGEAQIIAAGDYTHSIDAALGLVNRVLPGCNINIIRSDTIQSTRGKMVSCDLYDTTGSDGEKYGRFQGVGWEACGAADAIELAILIALFRALEAQEQQQ